MVLCECNEQRAPKARNRFDKTDWAILGASERTENLRCKGCSRAASVLAAATGRCKGKAHDYPAPVAGLRGEFPAREADEHAPVLWIVAGLVAQMLLIAYTGFSIATGILFAATARGMGRGPLWITIPIGIVLCARRPIHLIGSTSDIELLPYVVEIRASRNRASLFAGGDTAVP